MEVRKTFRATSRAKWRQWLVRFGDTSNEVWLVFFHKSSGKPCVSYDVAVEEALCFGWIDGIAKPFGPDCYAQRFTPRRPRSRWSELNKERARRMIAAGRMTPRGLAALRGEHEKPFAYPEDILEAIRAQPEAWEHFRKFPECYRRVRVGYIEEQRKNGAEFDRRLSSFVRSCAQNRLIGTLKPAR